MEGESDSYRTIANLSEGFYSAKRSKFYGFAIPVKTADEAKLVVKEYRKKYYDARHVCWAYMLGNDRLEFRANDDGEPSSTAGKPILGQINSNQLTDLLIVVVRYFGGVELGTSGLIEAYRAAALESIQAAEIIECTVDEEITLLFEYPYIDKIMRIIKESNVEIIDQKFELECEIKLRMRKSIFEEIKNKLLKIDSCRIKE